MPCSNSFPSKRLQNTASSFGSPHSFCMLCFCNKGKKEGQVPSPSDPPLIQRRKKKSAFINTTLVLTGWSLLTLMSLKSYLQRTSVKAEVRYASALNPLALNPAKLSHSFFWIEEENPSGNVQWDRAQLQERILCNKHMGFQGKQQRKLTTKLGSWWKTPEKQASLQLRMTQWVWFLLVFSLVLLDF